MQNENKYWKSIFGIELFKIRYFFQSFIYKFFSIKLPKLKSQKKYWQDRGQVYMDEIINSCYLDREIFFQNMLIDFLKNTEFDSFFEAGCGFGWNIKRVKDEFPQARVGGLDFSYSQLINSKSYLNNSEILVVNGDNCHIPYKDNTFDIGFSLGVFMNIHFSNIRAAFTEMIRVCRKYIIHIEYNEDHTTSELRQKRAFKTNIVSHDYKRLYEELGVKIVEYRTYKDFGKLYEEYAKSISTDIKRWEGFEGSEKYIFIVIGLQ